LRNSDVRNSEILLSLVPTPKQGCSTLVSNSHTSYLPCLTSSMRPRIRHVWILQHVLGSMRV